MNMGVASSLIEGDFSMYPDTTTLAKRLCAASVLLFSLCNLALAGPIVDTASGPVEGLAGQHTDAFLGIPFAAPPVGELRWRAPAPVPAWSEPRPATKAGMACTQTPYPLFGISPSSEDCLYLNVYVPKSVPKSKVMGKLPVMVFVHGGGFVGGAGSAFDGGELARQTHSIVVTINYRLGVFGFLALPSLSEESPAGNHALLDQQAAMRWVQRNVANFGGDKHRVTLFGQSAGGMSICHHLVSPTADKLFHRAIIQSGPCTLGAITEQAARKAGEAFADRIGCPAEGAQLACLRVKRPEEIMAASPPLILGKLSAVLPVMPWIDGVVVPGMPLDLIKRGHFHRVPVMVGANSQDANFLVGVLIDFTRGSPLTEADIPLQIRELVANEDAHPRLAEVYTSAQFGSPNLAMAALATDGLYTCNSLRTAEHLSLRVPTYSYEFEDRSVGSVIQDPFLDWGAFHAGELRYLLGTPEERGTFSSAQTAHAERMMRYWGRFAATGNPNGATDSIWPRYLHFIAPTQRLGLAQSRTAWGWSDASVYKDHRCHLWGPDTAIDSAVR
jgi:para-nitrobenzyl esterase